MTPLLKSLLLVSALLGGLGYHAQTNPAGLPPLQAIPHLDVQRYLGRWVEIAKFPNRFQKQCVSSTSANYSLEADGRLRVLNQCKLASGDWERALGQAK